MNKYSNPFEITSAKDMSDEQIRDFWVDMPNLRFVDLVKPTSPMPMIILGGKGSGKTHLMRYFSYNLQKMRNPANIIKGLQNEGYIGTYFGLPGLNTARFNVKKGGEKFLKIFIYYMDLYIADRLLEEIRDAFNGNEELKKNENNISKDILKLFSLPEIRDSKELSSLSDTINFLDRLRTNIDLAVNNYSLNPNLIDKLIIGTNPGGLIFGIPIILKKYLSQLKNILFLYLMDQLEDIDADHQKHINSLIRDKTDPVSFKIGSRLYGIKTYDTYSAGEIIKEGAEYERLLLDAHFRLKNKNYKAFARKLCTNRLIEADYLQNRSINNTKRISIDSFFEEYQKDEFATHETAFVTNKYLGEERPYFKILRNKLEDSFNSGVAYGLLIKEHIDQVITLLSVPEYPLLEKANLLLFYREWFNKRNLVEAAQKIAEDCAEYKKTKDKRKKYGQVLSHFREDFLAQIMRECRGKRNQLYLGLGKFIDMSQGLPRYLLLILKETFKWAVFNGENPFKNGKISMESQRLGVLEASISFFNDERDVGLDQIIIRDSISKLATLLRAIRFSDKPSECSISTFSANMSRISIKAQHILKSAENWSFLIRIPIGQRDRNSSRVDTKYQLHSMLSPQWELPIYRRGAIALNPSEVNAIFDPHFSGEFENILKGRVNRMTAPNFGKATPKKVAK